MILLYDFSADKYVREVVNEGGEDDEIVDSDGEVISLIFLSLSYSVASLYVRDIFVWIRTHESVPLIYCTDPE
jgi:hypothetical protein